MTRLPKTRTTLFVRTWFSDEEAWQALATAVSTPSEDGFLAFLHVVDDPAHRDLTPEQVAAAADGHRLIIVADEAAMTGYEMPLLALYPHDGEWAELRVVAQELWSVENNLSIANMDWQDFTTAVDHDGVFRGF